MYKVSVVAPVYGVEKYINQFLDSIRKQTIKDFEVILVNDGSKDNCPQILDDFANENERYKVFHQENTGVSIARNNGLDHISGEYVYIVDSDDWLEPNALEVLWAEAERTKADIVYGDWIRERNRGSERLYCFPRPFVTESHDTIQTLQFAVNNQNKRVRIARPEFSEIRHFGGAPWRGMIKTSLIVENHLRFDPYVRGVGDDILFSLHLYEYVKKVAYIQSVIYHYRILDDSYSHGFKADYLESMVRIFERQEVFLKKYNKGELAWKAYYTRVLIYLLQGMERYFKNDQNLNTAKERYQEFLRIIREEPYRIAIQKAPLKYMGEKKMWVTTFLLKAKIYRLYWFLST